MKAKAPLAAMFIALLAGCATTPPPTTVTRVDLKRYAGVWHEVGRYPNWFQRSCVGSSTAEYTPLPDGSIRVINSCRKKNGELEKVTGRATVVDGSGNARLKVGFGGPFTGDYWVIALDPSYRWAIVGHPSRRFLWILTRDPEISDANYQRLVDLAVAQGYDAEKIQRVAP